MYRLVIKQYHFEMSIYSPWNMHVCGIAQGVCVSLAKLVTVDLVVSKAKPNFVKFINNSNLLQLFL